MNISNLSSIVDLLKKEVSSESGTTTNNLNVIAHDSDSIVVESSVVPDTLIKLRGVNGAKISIGSVVTVNTETGELTIIKDAAPTSKPNANSSSSGATRGCLDRSFIFK